MKKNKLTIKQENFCQEYIRNKGHASNAYKFAYGAEKYTEKSLNEKASHTLALDKIKARIQELKNRLAKRNEVTLDKLNAELIEARDMAKNEDDYREIRANVMDRAKLNGLIVDNTKITATVAKETHDEYIKRVCKDD